MKHEGCLLWTQKGQCLLIHFYGRCAVDDSCVREAKERVNFYGDATER